MGQVDDRLDRPLHLLADHAVEQQGQPERGGEGEEELQAFDLERVRQGELEVGIVEDGAEVVEPDPRAALESEERASSP